LLDRIAGVGVLLISGLLCAPAMPLWMPWSARMSLLLAVSGMLAMLLLPKLLSTALPLLDPQRRFPALHQLAHTLDLLRWLRMLLISALICLVNITFYWSALHAVQGEQNWPQIGLYTCLLNLALLLPVSLAGVGLREQIAVAMFAQDGGAAVQVAFGCLVLLVNLGHALLALPLMWAKKKRA
jgi:hypothetical protein